MTVMDRRDVLGLAAGLAATPLAARAQSTPHQLKVGDRLDRFDRLTPGVRVYLRSVQNGEMHAPADIWRRETRIETIDGVDRLRIVQRWDSPAQGAQGAQPGKSVERDSTFELHTFRPLTHTRITTDQGARTVEGFRFTDGGIVGLPDLADNIHRDFSIAGAEPAYNFETDMEMLQTLPLDAGYSVSIPFYHPGSPTPPTRYLWVVTGDERLAGPDGRAIDCWVVQTDYNAPQRPPARFWLAKTTQQLVKHEAATPTGVVHRKTLLTL